MDEERDGKEDEDKKVEVNKLIYVILIYVINKDDRFKLERF